MATPAKDNLKEFLTCAVCYEEFNGRDPRSLPCLHVFCLTCIQSIHQTASNNQASKLRDDEFRCPTCQTVSPISQNEVSNFPKYFHANTLNDIYQDINESTKTSLKKWTSCWNDQCEVERYCFTCTRPFCQQCIILHNKTKRYADHVHVKVTKDNIQCLVCTEHDQFVEAYCTDCGSSVCGQCLLTTHTGHVIKDFALSKVPDQGLWREINERLLASKKNHDRIDQLQKDFNANINSVKNEISKHADEMINNILRQSKSLRAELDKHQRDTIREFEKMKEQLRESHNLIIKAEQQAKEKTQPIPELPDVHTNDVEKIIADIKNQLPNIYNVKENVKKYQFNPETSPVLLGTLLELCKSLPSPSSVQLSLPGREYRQSSVQTSGRVQAQGESRPSSGAARPTPTKLIKKRKCEGFVTDVVWTNTEDLIVLNFWTINVYDRSGNKKPTPVELSHFEGSVSAIAVHPTKSTVALIVASERGAHIYMAVLGSGKSAERVCILPHHYSCLLFSNDGDLLACVNKKICKYKTDGTKLWESDTPHKASHITVLPDNKFLVSGDGQMSVYDKDGQFISFFPSDPQILPDPRGVCSDSRGHVYVVDYKKNAVLLFAKNGRYIQGLMTKKECPTHLVLFNDKYLCLIQQQKFLSTLCVYSLE